MLLFLLGSWVLGLGLGSWVLCPVLTLLFLKRSQEMKWTFSPSGQSGLQGHRPFSAFYQPQCSTFYNITQPGWSPAKMAARAESLASRKKNFTSTWRWVGGGWRAAGGGWRVADGWRVLISHPGSVLGNCHGSSPPFFLPSVGFGTKDCKDAARPLPLCHVLKSWLTF